MSLKSVFTYAAIGASLTFFLDQTQGRRRRAVFRDKLRKSMREIGNGGQVLLRDMRNRITGMYCELRALARREKVDDDLLVRRVAAQLGRVCSHPRAIEVSAENGHVILRGPVLENEVDALMKEIYHVRGVIRVQNDLTPYQEGSDIPELQGQPRSRSVKHDFSLFQEQWSPQTRFIAFSIGSFFALKGLRSRNAIASNLYTCGGLCLISRAIINKPILQAMGVDLRGLRQVSDRLQPPEDASANGEIRSKKKTRSSKKEQHKREAERDDVSAPELMSDRPNDQSMLH